ncbi:MAG: RHS repeat-associated core domain-containing protein [Bacteroidota bacterium]
MVYSRYYYLKDHTSTTLSTSLGSIRVTLNENGGVAGDACPERSRRDDFYPFGLQLPGRSNNSANRDDDQKTCPDHSGFTGHFFEQEGDLDIPNSPRKVGAGWDRFYHAQARMYDPATGRFWGVDGIVQLKTPIELVHYDGAKHLSLSPYVYVRNNPLIYVDPDGLTDWNAIGKGFWQITTGTFGMIGGAKLTIASGAAIGTGVGAPLGVAGMLTGNTMTGLSAANFGAGIKNITDGFKAKEGEVVDTANNSVTTISLGMGANETQASSAELGFSLISTGGLYGTGKLIANDKIIRATIEAADVANNVDSAAQSYEDEYIEKEEK